MAYLKQKWENGDIQYDINDAAQTTSTLKFLVFAAADETEVLAAATAADGVPTEYMSISLTKLNIVSRLTEDIWEIEAVYAPEDSGTGGGGGDDDVDDFSFGVSTETKNVVESFNTKKYPTDAPDPASGINDGKGVDIMMPAMTFTVTKTRTSCDPSDIAATVGSVNSNSFHGFAAGEVLQIGASGSKTGSAKWRVGKTFAVRKNESGKKVGTVTGIEAKGWEYVWTKTGEKLNSDTGKPEKTVLGVYVEQVYPENTLSD